jgi:hypothetical protein
LREELHQRLQETTGTGDGLGLLVSYSGTLGPEVTDSLLVLTERAAEAAGSNRKQTRRVGHVLIEALQNVGRHGWVDSNGDTPFFMAMELTPLGFQIQTGNVVDFDSASELRERLAAVNGMNRDELRKAYVETLCDGELTERGGAGLGLISMAKRAEGPLNYQFADFEGELFLFTLSVMVRN